jgi:hypothetical protein
LGLNPATRTIGNGPESKQRRGLWRCSGRTIQHWPPEGHPAHASSDTAGTQHAGAFHVRCDSSGALDQPLHSAKMINVLLPGHAMDVSCSRRISRTLHQDVAMLVLVAGDLPSHRKIRDFRAAHATELSDLLVQVVHLARETGPLKHVTIAMDGTKVKVQPAASGPGTAATCSRPTRCLHSRDKRRLGCVDARNGRHQTFTSVGAWTDSRGSRHGRPVQRLAARK